MIKASFDELFALLQRMWFQFRKFVCRKVIFDLSRQLHLQKGTIMKIEQARDIHEGRLMELPNVIGVGIGEKDGQPVIKVFVTQKVDVSSLNPEEVVPKRLSDFIVDVEEIGNVMAGNE